MSGEYFYYFFNIICQIQLEMFLYHSLCISMIMCYFFPMPLFMLVCPILFRSVGNLAYLCRKQQAAYRKHKLQFTKCCLAMLLVCHIYDIVGQCCCLLREPHVKFGATVGNYNCLFFLILQFLNVNQSLNDKIFIIRFGCIPCRTTHIVFFLKKNRLLYNTINMYVQ